MTREEHLLVKVIEECNEVSQRATKALRFGLDEVQPNNPDAKNNEERLFDEFLDLMAAMHMLYENMDYVDNIPESLIDEKIKRVEEYLEYSRILGKLE